jgi:hypothetical protein
MEARVIGVMLLPRRFSRANASTAVSPERRKSRKSKPLYLQV